MGTAYAQSDSYIPSTDAGFKDWILNFATLIAQDPAKYDLDASDAAILTDLSDSYAAAYQTAVSPSTRTPNAIGQKDAIRASAVGSCRVYAQNIKGNKGLTNDDKLALGIHVDDPTNSPISTPSTAPLLNIIAGFSGEHEVRYADETTPTSRKKPYGALQIQVNRTVQTGANPDPDASTMVGLYTKQPIIIQQNPSDVGKTATYFGRWVTRTGLFGPWSLPVGMTIAFGGPVDQTMPTGGTELAGGDDLKIAA